MEKYTKDYLQTFTIHDVRKIARTVGVKSPTSLRKDQIIDKIMQIQSGEESPRLNLNHVGRPAKTNDSIEIKLDDASFSYFEISNWEKLNSNCFICESAKPTFDSTDYTKVLGTIEGTVRILNSGDAIIYENGSDYLNYKYVMSKDNVLKNHLQTGDSVVAEYKASQIENIYIVEKIISNCFGVREDYKNVLSSYPNVAIDFSNCKYVSSILAQNLCPIGFGSRALINYAPDVDIETFAYDIISKTRSQFDNVFCMLVDESPETTSLFRQITNVDFYKEFRNNDEISSIYDFIVRFGAYRSKTLENSKTLLVINNLTKFYNLVYNYYSRMYKTDVIRTNIESDKFIKSVLFDAKYISPTSSLTILCFQNQSKTHSFDNEIFTTMLNIDFQVNSFEKTIINPISSHTKQDIMLLNEKQKQSQVEIKKSLIDEKDLTKAINIVKSTR